MTTDLPIQRCIIGLGNPGAAFLSTRHNLGAAAIDVLAARHGLTAWREEPSVQLCRWAARIGHHADTLLVKPSLGINHSGEVLGLLAQRHGLTAGEVLVLVDDATLEWRELRLRSRGTARGHNGLRDIERTLGRGYARLGIGIGRPPAGQELGVFVLEALSGSHLQEVPAVLERVADCCETYLTWGAETATRHNGRGG
jgi:PTH1 family peptidyl-tRNA hydrolase